MGELYYRGSETPPSFAKIYKRLSIALLPSQFGKGCRGRSQN